MREQIFNLLLIFLFTIGSLHNFKMRKECIYNEKITKPMIIVIAIIPLIFLCIAYFTGNSLKHYIVSISASIFFISGVIGQGINEKGIYYRPIGKASVLIRLAKWEDIDDIKIDINKNKLESFKFKTTRVYQEQYYNQQDINEIKKLIDGKTFSK